MPDLFNDKITGKTQADGAQIISLGSNDRFREHQLQIEVSAQPAAGSLAVAVKTPGANVFSHIDSIDLTAITATNGKIWQPKFFACEIKFTPTGFDADKTYSVIVASGAGV